MRKILYISFFLVLPAMQLIADNAKNECRTFYAVQGSTVTITLPAGVSSASAQPMSMPVRRVDLEIKNASAVFTPPSARVPVLWKIYHCKGPATRILAKVISYPPDMFKKQGNSINIWAVAPPEWFVQWAAAVGLTVRRADSFDELQKCLEQADEECSRKNVTIIGCSAAGKDFEKFLGVIKPLEAKTGILIFDAEWFEPVKCSFTTGMTSFTWLTGDENVNETAGTYTIQFKYLPVAWVGNRIAMVRAKPDGVLFEAWLDGGVPLAYLCYADLQAFLGQDVQYDSFLMKSLLVAADRKPFAAKDSRNMEWLWPSRLENIIKAQKLDDAKGKVYIADSSIYASALPTDEIRVQKCNAVKADSADRLLEIGRKKSDGNETFILGLARFCDIQSAALIMDKLTRWGVILETEKLIFPKVGYKNEKK